MTDPVQRIEAALTRIEAAARQRSEDRRDLARRHGQLRDRVAEAVAAIDELSARVGGANPAAPEMEATNG